MLAELNRLLDRLVGDIVMPTYTGENGFLNHVVTPLYGILKAVGFCVPILKSLLSFYML